MTAFFEYFLLYGCPYVFPNTASLVQKRLSRMTVHWQSSSLATYQAILGPLTARLMHQQKDHLQSDCEPGGGRYPSYFGSTLLKRSTSSAVKYWILLSSGSGPQLQKQDVSSKADTPAYANTGSDLLCLVEIRFLSEESAE